MDSKPSADELAWLMRQGLTLQEAAKRYGVSGRTLHKWCRSLGLSWPNKKYTRVDFHGEKVTLLDGARRAELPASVVYSRYYRGKRGRDLWRPASGTHSRHPASQYELDMDGTEWDLVLDCYRTQIERFGDRRRAKRATADKMGIPKGAVGAAERGEWHRLG